MFSRISSRQSLNRDGENGMCPICVEKFKTAKVLVCGHTLCLDCLKSLIRGLGLRRNSGFQCPICRQYISIPADGAESFPTNFALLASLQDEKTTEPKAICPNHSQRDVEMYCADCEIGLCLKCILMEHKMHEFVDLESEDSRADVLKQVSKQKEQISIKITAFRKTNTVLDKTSKDLNKSFTKIVCVVKEAFETNKGHLDQVKSETQDAIDKMSRGILQNTTFAENNTLELYKARKKLQELGNIPMPKIDSPMVYLEWDGSGNTDDILGHVRCGFLFVPNTNDFTFNIQDIQVLEVKYISPDEISDNDAVWRCCVKKNFKGNFGIFIELSQNTNQNLEYIHIKYQLTLLNKEKNKDLTKKVSSPYKFSAGTCGRGWGEFINWDKLIDKTEEFIDSTDQFIVRFTITEVGEIKWKQV